MIDMIVKTNLYKGNQTVLPSEVRKLLDVEGKGKVVWDINLKEKTVKVLFEKQPTLHDLSGIAKINKKTNAVDLKHKSQRGLI